MGRPASKKARIALQQETINSLNRRLLAAKHRNQDDLANKILNDLMLAKEFLRAEREKPDD